jgi:prephenate dehydrogenase
MRTPRHVAGNQVVLDGVSVTAFVQIDAVLAVVRDRVRDHGVIRGQAVKVVVGIEGGIDAHTALVVAQHVVLHKVVSRLEDRHAVAVVVNQVAGNRVVVAAPVEHDPVLGVVVHLVVMYPVVGAAAREDDAVLAVVVTCRRHLKPALSYRAGRPYTTL